MSTAVASKRPPFKAAISSIIFGIAALCCMVVPLILNRLEHATDAKAPMAVVLGIGALILGTVSLVKCGNRLGFLGIALALVAIAWGGTELNRRVQPDTSGPPPGGENAMPDGGEVKLDLGMQEEAPPKDAAPKETDSEKEAAPN